MAWVRRLASIFPGFGTPVQNDTLFQSVANALSGTTQAQVALSGLTPAISAGKLRVKIYQFGGTSPTVLNLVMNATDGVEVVCIAEISPVVATVSGGGLTLTDGAMSATGVKVLTSATGAFTSALVGRQVSVSTAGNAAGTATLTSTVTAYTSATSITLADGSLKTAAVSSATILFPPYSNIGVKTAGSLALSGYDFIFPFCLDFAATEFDVNYTLGGTSPTAQMDVEVLGTV